MRHKKITVALDEMFRSGKPCLVAIEVVSNYILLEKFTENRTAETWTEEIKSRVEGINIEIVQVVSDLCGAIRACTKKLEAEHIPELFHAQRDISKATSAALSAKKRGSEKALDIAENTLKKMREKPREIKKKAVKERKAKIKEKTEECNRLKKEFEERSTRQESVKSAVRELGDIHHPINLETGKLQTAAEVEKRVKEQLDIATKSAKEAELSGSSMALIEKSKRAFKAIGCYIKYYFTVYMAFVNELQLSDKQKEFFNEVVFPLSYLKATWRKLPLKKKGKYRELLKNLKGKIRDGPWSEELKEEWMKKGKE